MKKPSFTQILISLLAMATIPLTLFYTDHAISHQPAAVTRKNQSPLLRVTVQQVSAGDYSGMIEAFGEVNTTEDLTLLSQVSGLVVWKAEQFQVGHQVKQGELLLRIDDSAYRVALANAQKELADASLALMQARRKQRRAEQDWERSEISAQPSDLALRKPQLKIAQAQYDAAKENVANARNNLSQTQIYAPFDAVITSRAATPGVYLSPGSTIAAMKAIGSAEINVALAEREWQQLPATLDDVSVTIRSTEDSQRSWRGKAEHLSLIVDENNRTRYLTVRVARPLTQETPLLFGSFVQVQLAGKEQKDIFRIPTAAVTADGYLWFVRDQSLAKHKVNTRFNSGKFLGVAREELPQTLNLVRRPLSRYVEGMKVAAVMMGETDAD
ncbi:TPA: efflux RND transporter periplasmic adaptor subunit [Vibrio vulnificus]|uniref:efflux RND transporter periplasmic adaptor subunit n=1 Tax=Vibrio vulnificus TaxID=672 RepID=UPI000690FA55|nr:efflux RND transporter periplasmic adaptor subunit [Vibrio vulnificus]RZR26809.1 efflux RND transporter periplasmic adaptor subunit [Vibrio vulnificus]HAS8290892.1 efflux RND transporter periplasmic adaptor subunit [Vibrio vulnificus]HAS8335020.1 efflux RND transporter periplasmic adaptor subunit [Vibrio vulnificus]HAS8532294.1 efflux RND transporter periplasmic adaptor subunit [Vibrio vulnificus]